MAKNNELALAQMTNEMRVVLNQFKGIAFSDLTKLERNIMRVALRALNLEMVLEGQDETINFKEANG